MGRSRTLSAGRRASAVLRRAGLDVRRVPGEQRDRLLRQVLDHHSVETCIDVGAHVGGFARHLRHTVGFRGTILSVEPDPQSFVSLQAAFARDSRWSGLQVAVSETGGPVSLLRYRESQFQSLLRPSDAGKRYASELQEPLGAIEVPSVRLEELVAKLGPGNALLKLDTQGLDLNLLESCDWPKIPAVRALICEVPWMRLYEGSRRFDEYLEFVRDHGWTLVGLFQIHNDRRSLEIVEFDLIATRTDT